MINCNQCGKINPTGAVQCQSCGAPLSSMVDGGMSPRPASPQQPELPAWLESLRAGERSAPPAHAAANFSAADFVDENSLPSWMRAERNDARDNTGPNPPVTARPSSLPGPITDGEPQPPTGITARSLLDEQALPAWMQEGQQSGPVSPQEKIPAASLVQPESMPDWMKSLQRGRASFAGDMGGGAVPPTPSQMSTPQPSVTPQRPPVGSQSPSSPAQAGQAGFSARDLIDPQSLPSWMTQPGGNTTAAPAKSNQTSSPSIPAFSSMPSQAPSSPIHSDQAGFSARDLIDPQSLPSWMVQQGGQAGQPPRSSQVARPDTVRNPGQPGQGQTLPASSLLDMNSLPAWLHENEQGGKAQGQSSPLANQAFQMPSSTPPRCSVAIYPHPHFWIQMQYQIGCSRLILNNRTVDSTFHLKIGQ